MPDEPEEVGNQKPPRATRFGGERANPGGRGPKEGTRYLKSALKRAVAENPGWIDQIARMVLEDAAGKTKLAVMVGSGKDSSIEEVDIAVVDRQRATAFLRDTLDGKPVLAIDVGGAISTNLIIAHATGEVDPALAEEIQALVVSDEETGEMDLENPHQDPEKGPEPAEDEP